jgi:hypothetical protein
MEVFIRLILFTGGAASSSRNRELKVAANTRCDLTKAGAPRSRCPRPADEISLAVKLFSRSVVILFAGISASAAAVRADSASGIRERKVDVGEGVSLRVIEAGQAGPAPTLVFVPGWSAGADIWRQQIDRLAPTY